MANGLEAPGGEHPYSAPGDVFQAPPIAGYVERQSGGLQPPVTHAPGASTAKVPAERARSIGSAVTGVCGLVVLLSTFLRWMWWLFGGLSGWQIMAHPGQVGGNFLWVSGSGVLFFTGFWSILVGLCVITGAVIFFRRVQEGARLVQVAGAVGAILALINIITLQTHQGSSGIGVWLFLVFSAFAAIAGELTWRYTR
jgi:hypothetical protein